MSEWQPIETAPLDGTRILGGFAKNNLDSGIVLVIKRNCGCWICAEDGFAVRNPDGWMPLPEPPKK